MAKTWVNDCCTSKYHSVVWNQISWLLISKDTLRFWPEAHKQMLLIHALEIVFNRMTAMMIILSCINTVFKNLQLWGQHMLCVLYHSYHRNRCWPKHNVDGQYWCFMNQMVKTHIRSLCPSTSIIIVVTRLYFSQVTDIRNNLSQEDSDAPSVNLFTNGFEKTLTDQIDLFKGTSSFMSRAN